MAPAACRTAAWVSQHARTSGRRDSGVKTKGRALCLALCLYSVNDIFLCLYKQEGKHLLYFSLSIDMYQYSLTTNNGISPVYIRYFVFLIKTSHRKPLSSLQAQGELQSYVHPTSCKKTYICDKQCIYVWYNR